MVCGAIAVVKAVVEEQYLKDLLDKKKEQVMEMLRAWLKARKVPNSYVRESPYNKGIGVVLGVSEFTIVDGKVTWDGYSDGEFIKGLEEIVPNITNALFADEIGRILATKSRIKKRETVTVDDNGARAEATIFYLSIGAYNMRVFALPGGRLEIMTDNGLFADAKRLSEALLASLSLEGTTLSQVGRTETHAESKGHVHVSNAQIHTL